MRELPAVAPLRDDPGDRELAEILLLSQARGPKGASAVLENTLFDRNLPRLPEHPWRGATLSIVELIGWDAGLSETGIKRLLGERVVRRRPQPPCGLVNGDACIALVAA